MAKKRADREAAREERKKRLQEIKAKTILVNSGSEESDEDSKQLFQRFGIKQEAKRTITPRPEPSESPLNLQPFKNPQLLESKDFITRVEKKDKYKNKKKDKKDKKEKKEKKKRKKEKLELASPRFGDEEVKVDPRVEQSPR